MTPIDYSSEYISQLEDKNTELHNTLEQYEARLGSIEALLDTMTATTATDPQLDTLRELVRDK